MIRLVNGSLDMGALFYAGYNGTINVNTTHIFSPTVTLVQAETSIGTSRNSHGGASL